PTCGAAARATPTPSPSSPTARPMWTSSWYARARTSREGRSRPCLGSSVSASWERSWERPSRPSKPATTAERGRPDMAAQPGASMDAEEGGIVNPASDGGITALGCGRPFRMPAGAGLLALTGRFPAVAPAGAQVVSGAVEVTSGVPTRGVVLPQAEVFLVRDGRVATVPVLQDALGLRLELAPGRIQ